MYSKTGPKGPGPFLFIDFDGVICDSLEECFLSSWLALQGVGVGSDRPPEPSFDDEYRRLFRAARPYVRSGEDYLVVHGWAATGRVPASQDEFDADLEARGVETMAELKRRLYATREALLAHHRDLWLSWNPLYPGMAQALAAQASNPNVWILSTKKAEFIEQILGSQGVGWPLERTIYTGPRKKLEIIDADFGGPSALIDDQIDHLDFGHPRCRCLLALWGYAPVGAEGRARESLSLSEGLDWIKTFPARLLGE